MKNRLLVFLIIFVCFLPLTFQQVSGDDDYPVLELDKDITGVIGKELILIVTAFSIYNPIRLYVRFFDISSNITYTLFNQVYEYLVNDEVVVNCSSLAIDDIYVMIIEVEDNIGQTVSLDYEIEIDINDPNIEYFRAFVSDFSFGESLAIEYYVVDTTFDFAEIYIGDKYIELTRSRTGVFELSYLDFQLPSGYSTYEFIIRMIAYDKAGNSATSSFGVVYYDEFQGETYEERMTRNKNVALLFGCVIIFYLVLFIIDFLGSKKIINLIFYSRKEGGI